MPGARRAPEDAEAPRVTVFGPDPLLSVTVEATDGADDVHVHAAGQGVWVATMAAEMGSRPILCGMVGGEAGEALQALLARRGVDLRAVASVASSGSYITDRRSGERRMIAFSPRRAPRRHELDDLVAATVVSAMTSRVLVLCNPYPAEGFPNELYDTVLADVKGSGAIVVADLSSPRLEHTLSYRPDLVKLNDWELAQYVRGPVDGARAIEAARRLVQAGARTVAVTRAEAPILVLSGDAEPFEIVPPSFSLGYREGTGDAMTGALAAALARGLPMSDALVLGAAAGSGNFLRHGLGSGRREVAEALASRVAVRPLRTAGSAPGR